MLCWSYSAIDVGAIILIFRIATKAWDFYSTGWPAINLLRFSSGLRVMLNMLDISMLTFKSRSKRLTDRRCVADLNATYVDVAWSTRRHCASSFSQPKFLGIGKHNAKLNALVALGCGWGTREIPNWIAPRGLYSSPSLRSVLSSGNCIRELLSAQS